MKVYLCDECAPKGCEQLLIGVLIPGPCWLCLKESCGRNAYRMAALREYWLNEGFQDGRG